MAESRPAEVASVGALLRYRARHQPDRLGYRFLADGETDEQLLTYAAADRRARAVAAAVRAAGAGAGARVLLVLPPGLDYVVSVFGCLYASTVAVPVYPPDPFRLDRSLGRVTAVVRDAEPVVALTVAPLLSYLEEIAAREPELAGLRWVAVDEAPDFPESDTAAADPDDLAVLQYTSGSTAQPKGVMLTHRNLLHNSDLIRRIFGTTPESQGVVWLPPYHDMGLIGGLVQPLYVGCPVTLMSPLHFLEQPLRWLRAIDRYRGTVSGGPNFAFDLCARRATAEDVAALDLSSWEVAFNGAEPIRPDALARFGAAFGPAGFRSVAFLPCYGLAEATLIVSGEPGLTVLDVDADALARDRIEVPGERSVRLVACGTGGADQRIVVVEPETGAELPPDRVGEIWVAGPSVARGYWRNPAATEEAFAARTAAGEGPFLRSGDLGFRMGERLVVTGRRKDVLIVRGRNYYPQDVEATAERAHPALRPGCTAAFMVEGGDREEARLTVVLEVRRGRSTDVELDGAAVTAHVREAVAAEHGLQVSSVVLVAAGELPKTSSGKVQRWLARERLSAGDLTPLWRHDRSPDVAEQPLRHHTAEAGTAGYLRGAVAQVAGVDVAEVDPDRPLVASGLDSLGATQLRHRVAADLGVRPAIGMLMSDMSLRDVAAALAAALDGTAAPAGTPDAPSAYATGAHELPLSHGQRWMWVVSHLDPDNTGYHLSAALRLPAPADAAALQRAVDLLVARHPALRTTFPVRGGERVQAVHAELPVAVREHPAATTDDALVRRLARAATRPFDLAEGPLLRVETHGTVLLLVVHHMVVDFLAMAVLSRELGVLYAAGADARLDPPAVTYPDVVVAQQRLLGDGARSRRLARYWDAQVHAGLPRLRITALGAPAGARRVTLAPALTRRLRALAAREHVTLYALLLAAFQTVLHRRTGQDDLVVGANTAGRDHAGYTDVVGCCTNPVPLRSRARPEEPFRDVLARTRDQVVGALEHQDYPAMLIAERHRTILGGRPLFEALFTFNRGVRGTGDLAAAVMTGLGGTCRLGPFDVEIVALPPGQGAVPLELVVAEVAGELHGMLRYEPDRLTEADADTLVADLLAALDAVATDPRTAVGDLVPPSVAVGSRGARFR